MTAKTESTPKMMDVLQNAVRFEFFFECKHFGSKHFGSSNFI